MAGRHRDPEPWWFQQLEMRPWLGMYVFFAVMLGYLWWNVLSAFRADIIAGVIILFLAVPGTALLVLVAKMSRLLMPTRPRGALRRDG